jgi:hypothetical protein
MNMTQMAACKLQPREGRKAHVMAGQHMAHACASKLQQSAAQAY